MESRPRLTVAKRKHPGRANGGLSPVSLNSESSLVHRAMENRASGPGFVALGTVPGLEGQVEVAMTPVGGDADKVSKFI